MEKKAYLDDFGLTKEIMNSLALFIFYRNYEEKTSAVQIFNDWAKICSIKFTKADTVASIVDHIRKLSNLEQGELKKAIEQDLFKTGFQEGGSGPVSTNIS